MGNLKKYGKRENALLNHKPTSNQKYINFYQAVGQKYPEEEIVYRSLRGILRKKFVEKWLSQQNGTLLDIGTGEGIYLREYKGKMAIGIDIALSKILKARKRLPESLSHSCRFVVSDAEALWCFKQESFDVILCSEVIEHLVNPESLWQAVYNLLKPGGTALITCPFYKKNRPGWTPLGLLKLYGIPDIKNDQYYHTAFTPEELQASAELNGLEVVEKGTVEKEIRYAVIPSLFVYVILEKINRWLLHSDSLERWNQCIMDRGSYVVYRIICFFKLQSFLNQFVRYGVRSYSIIKKPLNTLYNH